MPFKQCRDGSGRTRLHASALHTISVRECVGVECEGVRPPHPTPPPPTGGRGLELVGVCCGPNDLFGPLMVQRAWDGGQPQEGASAATPQGLNLKSCREDGQLPEEGADTTQLDSQPSQIMGQCGVETLDFTTHKIMGEGRAHTPPADTSVVRRA